MAPSTPNFAARAPFASRNTWDRGIATLFWGAAILVVLYGTFIIWRYSWLDIYADQWYIYGALLDHHTAHGAVQAINGHRVIVPNLLRLAELRWLGGNQQLQHWFGMCCIVGTVLLFWYSIARDRTSSASARATSALIIATAVLWLANGRMLLHAAESTQIYLVTVMLALSCALLANRDQAGFVLRSTLVAVCGGVAALSFGYGAALFPTLAATLFLVRAPRVLYAPLAVGLLLALMLYFWLPGNALSAGGLRLAPIENASIGLRWLGMPLPQALRPFIDPAHAQPYLGDTLDEAVLALARTSEATYGTFDTWFWLPLLAGLTGVALTLWHSWRIWHDRAVSALGWTGLNLTWFGMGAAALIAFTRHDYFMAYPAQIAAERYLPLPALFWAGALILVVDGAKRARVAHRSLQWRVGLTALICAQVFATNATWRIWATYAQSAARTQSIAFMVDVMPPHDWLGETVATNVREALPQIRSARVAWFAHPSRDWLDRVIEPREARALGHGEYTLREFDNELGHQAASVDIAIVANERAERSDIWLLLDGERRVVGLAAPNPLRSTRYLRGVVRGETKSVLTYAMPWTGIADGSNVAIPLLPTTSPSN